MPFLPWRRHIHGKSPSSRPAASRGRGQPRHEERAVPGKRRRQRLPGDPGPAAAMCALLGKSLQEPEELKKKKGGWKRREGGGSPGSFPRSSTGRAARGGGAAPSAPLTPFLGRGVTSCCRHRLPAPGRYRRGWRRSRAPARTRSLHPSSAPTPSSTAPRAPAGGAGRGGAAQPRSRRRCSTGRRRRERPKG